MKNTNIVYGVVGILIGFLLSHLYTFNAFYPRQEAGNGMMHQMSDGSMMMNNGDMHGMMNSMMSGLAGKTGDAFDRAFLSEMIVHHQGAVDMAEAVLKNSKRPELIKLANEIISAQTTEINMMKGWEKSWFK